MIVNDEVIILRVCDFEKSYFFKSARVLFINLVKMQFFMDELLANKAKGRILKLVMQANKARQIFRKTIISTSWYAYYAVKKRGKKFLFFGKFRRALFSYNTRFEIRPFAFLPMNPVKISLKDIDEIIILTARALRKKCLYSEFSGSHFPAFGLNPERCSVSLRVQWECGKIRIAKTPTADTFHAVVNFK